MAIHVIIAANGPSVGPIERLQSSIPAGLEAGGQQAAGCRPGRLLGWLAGICWPES